MGLLNHLVLPLPISELPWHEVRSSRAAGQGRSPKYEAPDEKSVVACRLNPLNFELLKFLE